MAQEPPKFAITSMSTRKTDFFISHKQASGADQCAKLKMLLEHGGFTVWLDMSADDLTKDGMEEGVSQSRNVIIFLSDGVMESAFCQMEQRWAKQYGCKLIGVVEKDDRHSPADFGKEKERAPADLKHLLDDVEFIDYDRRNYKADAMVTELLQRFPLLGWCVAPLLVGAVRGPLDVGSRVVVTPLLGWCVARCDAL